MGRPSNAALAERARAEQDELPTITYTPIHPGDPADTLWNRHRFRANIPVKVRDVAQGLTAAQMIEAAKGNPWFLVEGEEQAKTRPTVPETPEQYRMHAVAWIRTATASRDMASKWRGEEELRTECGVSDDDVEYIQSIYRPRLAILKDSEALAQSAVNE
jgi:hypothetical protein